MPVLSLLPIILQKKSRKHQESKNVVRLRDFISLEDYYFDWMNISHMSCRIFLLVHSKLVKYCFFFPSLIKILSNFKFGDIFTVSIMIIGFGILKMQLILKWSFRLKWQHSILLMWQRSAVLPTVLRVPLSIFS